MSWSVRCRLVADGESTEVPLLGVSSDDAWRIAYSDGRTGRSPRPWRDAAKTYLAIIARHLGEPATRCKGKGPDEHAERRRLELMRENIKEARRTIGLAWRIADERSGALSFDVV